MHNSDVTRNGKPQVSGVKHTDWIFDLDEIKWLKLQLIQVFVALVF